MKLCGNDVKELCHERLLQQRSFFRVGLPATRWGLNCWISRLAVSSSCMARLLDHFRLAIEEIPADERNEETIDAFLDDYCAGESRPIVFH